MPTRNRRRYRVVVNEQRFYQEMKARDWTTRATAAAEIGVPESTLSKILSGKISPSAMTIDRMLTALDVPYQALFQREELS